MSDRSAPSSPQDHITDPTHSKSSTTTPTLAQEDTLDESPITEAPSSSWAQAASKEPETTSSDEFALEIEIPNQEVEKFEKLFKGNVLPQEIDRIHGIEPSLSKYRDVKLMRLKKTQGSGTRGADGITRSSLEVLQRRIEALEACNSRRWKEVRGIQEQLSAQELVIGKRIEDSQDKIFNLKLGSGSAMATGSGTPTTVAADSGTEGGSGNSGKNAASTIWTRAEHIQKEIVDMLRKELDELTHC
ncbi:hypothetical protein HK102_011256 [Quaeritorhiza haematococci]|nr:hypothetical protein HK102_011256 [Quaeritorhiza haematococci]